MKLKAKEIKTCRVAYLHSDGSAVLWHEKRDKDAGKVEWVTVYENIGINVSMEEGKRLIISKGVLPFLRVATQIRVHGPSIKGGSENTKKLGLMVETIELIAKNGQPWFISNFPGTISSDIYSYESKDTFKDLKNCRVWGDLKIKAVYTEEA